MQTASLFGYPTSSLHRELCLKLYRASQSCEGLLKHFWTSTQVGLGQVQGFALLFSGEAEAASPGCTCWGLDPGTSTSR